MSDAAPIESTRRAPVLLWWALGGLTALVTASAIGIAWVFAQNGATAKVHAIEVVREYPHDPRAYCQGLVFDDGGLFESTGHYGQSTVRRVDLATGRPAKVAALGRRHFGEGLALWDGKLVQLTWKAKLALVYDKDTLRREKTHRYTGEGWGLTHDGTHLIMSDGTATLRVLDPESFEVVRRIRVLDNGRAVDKLNELEYVQGEVLANVWYSDYIARIDPRTGTVLGWIDCSTLYPQNRRNDRDDVLNGIAWDAEKKRLFVTGKNWPKLFEISVKP